MLQLFNTVDVANVINKSLVLIKEYEVTFKESVSVINPTLTLRIDASLNIHECNYCYISDFNRYYFIEDIQCVNNDIYKFYLECDVLESFKDDILNSIVEINRGLKPGEYLNISPKFEMLKEIDIHKSDVTITKMKNIIISTIGG